VSEISDFNGMLGIFRLDYRIYEFYKIFLIFLLAKWAIIPSVVRRGNRVERSNNVAQLF
jgi:hypothetical protein